MNTFAVMKFSSSKNDVWGFRTDSPGYPTQYKYVRRNFIKLSKGSNP